MKLICNLHQNNERDLCCSNQSFKLLLINKIPQQKNPFNAIATLSIKIIMPFSDN